MEKIVISSQEVSQTRLLPEQPGPPEAKLPPVVPAWAKLSLWPLVLFLPLLCLLTIILRVAMRSLPPRTRHGWTAFLSTLLVTSGLLTSLSAIVIFSFVPLPSLVSAGLSDLDERKDFPTLPASVAMSAQDVSEKLKPLVAVISPGQRSWLTHEEMPSASFGAGMLLQANADGYLFITAHHVVDGPMWKAAGGASHVLVAMASGTWGAAAIIARHKSLDLALLWVPRDSGGAAFAEPVAKSTDVADGEPIFVIGHPEGLRFTLSTGIVSRTDFGTIQISAPVSPGNSGGPVFDSKGELVGIVVSMVDKHGDPNAENLNFAVRADALLDDSGWNFSKSGQKRLSEYRASLVAKDAVQATAQHNTDRKLNNGQH
jgi:S1-C subfamily serine protease